MDNRNKRLEELNKELDSKIKEIEEVTRTEGFWSVMPKIVFENLHFYLDEVSTINWREKLIFNEVTFLVGLALKSHNDNVILSEEKAKEISQKINTLFGELHKIYVGRIMSNFSIDRINQTKQEFFSKGEMIEEPIFYSGSGAYDFQYLDLALILYELDSDWIKENKGLSIEEIVEIAKNIHLFLTLKINTKSTKNESLEDQLSIKIEDFNEEEQDNLRKFFELFSCKPGGLNSNLQKPGGYNMAESHPIIEISEGKYFIPVWFNIAKSIYESPFYWMLKDKKYGETFKKQRGQANINIAEILLKNTFKDNSLILRDIKIINKSATKKEGKDITDIDLLFIAGNKAIVFQGKTKILTEPAKKGEIEAIRDDFSKAIQDAYEQGLLCRKQIINKDNILIDKDGKEIKLPETINDAYIVCLTSNPYPAVIAQIDALLTKDEVDPYPISWSVFDLDLIISYLNDPFDFLYYTNCRINLIDKVKSDDEINFLSYHINQKLPSGLKKNELLAIDFDFAQLIDANFPVLKGAMPMHPGFNKLYPNWKNKDFDYLINRLKDSKIPQFTDAIFLLNDIAGDGANDLIEQIKLARESAKNKNNIKNISLIFLSGSFGISYCCMSKNKGIDELEKATLMYADLNKYKSKMNKWIAFGGFFNESWIANLTMFNNYKWEFDSEKEKLSNEILKGHSVAPVGKKIGRNDPCPCDSGKKYKKCHGA